MVFEVTADRLFVLWTQKGKRKIALRNANIAIGNSARKEKCGYLRRFRIVNFVLWPLRH